MATQVGVTGADLEVDPNTGNGVLTATRHNPDGSTSPLGNVPMTAGQIALAKEVTPAAAAILQTQLAATGGVANEQIIASLFAFVLGIMQMNADAAPTHYAGPDVLVDGGS